MGCSAGRKHMKLYKMYGFYHCYSGITLLQTSQQIENLNSAKIKPWNVGFCWLLLLLTTTKISHSALTEVACTIIRKSKFRAIYFDPIFAKDEKELILSGHPTLGSWIGFGKWRLWTTRSFGKYECTREFISFLDNGNITLSEKMDFYYSDR
jgi:hypothetical protein